MLKRISKKRGIFALRYFAIQVAYNFENLEKFRAVFGEYGCRSIPARHAANLSHRQRHPNNQREAENSKL